MKKVKTIKVPLGTTDEGMTEMFNQMLGTDSVNICIAYPRYKRIEGLLSQLVKIFELVAASPFMSKEEEFKADHAAMVSFCAQARANIKEHFSYDLSAIENNLTIADNEIRKEFTAIYNAAKDCSTVNAFIAMCNELAPYKKNFSDIEKLNPKFVNAMAGVYWAPFPTATPRGDIRLDNKTMDGKIDGKTDGKSDIVQPTKKVSTEFNPTKRGLNIKHVFAVCSDNTRLFFVTVMNRAFDISQKLYTELQTPDIDIDKFIEVITSSLTKLEQLPELSRCKMAFQKLKESVALLKNNFNGYYKDFIQTKDNTIMMQHFVIDVSKSTDASPQLTAQFRTILKHFQKSAAMSENKLSPAAKKLFSTMNETIAQMDKKTSNLRIEPVDDVPYDGEHILI